MGWKSIPPLREFFDRLGERAEREQIGVEQLEKALGGGVHQLHVELRRVDHDRVGEGAQGALGGLLRLQDFLRGALAIGAQTGRHLVEGGGELADLIARLHRHMLVEVPLAELLCRLGQALHRAHDGTRQQPGDDRRDGKTGRQRNDHVARGFTSLFARGILGIHHVVTVDLQNFFRRGRDGGGRRQKLVVVKGPAGRIAGRQREKLVRGGEILRMQLLHRVLEVALTRQRDVVRPRCPSWSRTSG